MESLTFLLLVCKLFLLSVGDVRASSATAPLKETTERRRTTADWTQWKKEHDPNQCGVYLANSTIPGAGLGMFAGKPMKKGDIITEGDVVIPLTELLWNNGHDPDFFWLWDSYVWSSNLVPELKDGETESKDLSAASPGIGAALNCLLGLVNLEDQQGCWVDNAGLHRSTDPGAGAFTPFYNRHSVVTRDLPVPGMELFIYYGEGYFSTRTSTYGLIPLTENFEQADQFLKYYRQLRDKVWPKRAKEHLKEMQKKSNKIVTTEDYMKALFPDELLDDMWASFVKSNPFPSRTLNALPPTRQLVDKWLDELGGSANQDIERSQRSIEWLEEHGSCMDHITADLSPIPNAGRGAFATRDLPKGTVVAPAPLIHIPNRSRMDMWGMTPLDEDGYVSRDLEKGPIHSQLLLNYCFGHPNTTMLLSPYGLLTSLINHDFERPNTILRWSTKLMREPSWLEKDPFELEAFEYSGLALEFVAIRDIAVGEEITVNYGREWEEAWQEHLQEWESEKKGQETLRSKHYLPAYELNSIYADVPLPTWKERYSPTFPYWDSRDGTKRLWIHYYFYEAHGLDTGKEYMRCIILDRYESVRYGGKTLYTAQVFYVDDEAEDDTKTTVEYDTILFDLPREAFVYDDETWTRDHQQTFSFRHEMMLPDEMLPKAWRNVK